MQVVYNPKKGIEKSALPDDVVFTGGIRHISDGNVKDFVKYLDKWKDPDQPCINVTIHVDYKDQAYSFDEIFTYRNDGENVVYGRRSKLGKFAAKYGKLPAQNMEVKAMTNSEGFLKLKLE